MHMYTTEEEHLLGSPMPFPTTSTTLHAVHASWHTAGADFALRLGRHASCGIFMTSLVFAGFPTRFCVKEGLLALSSRSPESFLVYPTWYSEKSPTKGNWYCSGIGLLESCIRQRSTVRPTQQHSPREEASLRCHAQRRMEAREKA